MDEGKLIFDEVDPFFFSDELWSPTEAYDPPQKPE